MLEKKMKTRFKLIFEGEPDLDLALFRKSIPEVFQVTEENDGIYVGIESTTPEDKSCQFLLERELDRHFFLTAVKIEASMICSRVKRSIKLQWRIHGGLPKDIAPQKWNYELPIQLRLWSIAVDSNEMLLKVILFFQIIELSYPNKSDYPMYTKRGRYPLIEGLP